VSRAGIRSLADFQAWAENGARGLTFAGPDPHHAIGLDRLVPGYRVASVDAPPALDVLAGEGVGTYAVDRVAAQPGTSARSAQALLADPGAAAFLNEQATVRLLVFKTNAVVESLCQANGWTLLAGPAAVARRWENKIAFRALAEGLGLRQPPGAVVDLAGSGYADIAAQLGPCFVLQAPHGYSGSRTHYVPDAAGFAAALASLGQRPARATSFLPGLPLTLNACVTARGVAVSAPFVQVTGVPALTRYPLGSCGNDWSTAQELDLDPAAFRTMAEAIGGALSRQGYRGVFGVDFVLGEEHQPYLIEVNPRLVASIALYTQLELAAGRLPLLARHVLAFLAPELDEAPLDQHESPVDGAQVILHNLAEDSRRVAVELDCGVVGEGAAAAGAVRGPPTAHVEGAGTGQLLRLTPGEGRVVGSGQELARLQSSGALADAAGRPRPAVLDAVRAILTGTGLGEPLSQSDAWRG
jgi:hypothetical protein